MNCYLNLSLTLLCCLLTAQIAYAQSSEGPSSGPLNSDISEALVYQDVQPLFRKYCNGCHYKIGPSPFSLESYSSIRKRGLAIKESLVSGIMPPWAVDEEHVAYSNSQAIPDSSKEKILQWIDEGMISGGANETDTIEKYFPYPEPDYSFAIAEMHTLESDTDTYFCSVIDPKFTEDVFARSIGFKSSNPEVVHHYILWVDTAGILDKLGDTWECKFSNISGQLVTIDGWAAGIRFVAYENGLTYRFKPGNKFLLQTHYNGYGNAGKTEQGTIELYTTSNSSVELEAMPIVNMEIFIPANQKAQHSIQHQLTEDITIYGMAPHMHYLGQTLSMYATSPEGEVINLLSISNWNYSAQGKYMLDEPKWLTKGTVLCVDVEYDNTEENPEQPNDPIRDVYWAQTSNDEMLSTMIYYSKGKNKLTQKGVLLLPTSSKTAE